MTEVRRSFFAALALGIGAPGLGMIVQGQWLLLLPLLAGGALWFGARKRRELMGWGSALCIGSLGLAVWFNVGMGWLLVGMAALLAAWDLDVFGAQLATVSRIENERRLIHAHWRRLAWVSVAGLLLGAMGLSLRVSLTFGLILVTALLAVLGLAQVVHSISKREKDAHTDVIPTP